MLYSRLVLIVSFLILFSIEGHAKDFIYNYIDEYKSIAISEMERSGIPASIKLAQGLLESDFGRSALANTANNHFGIKCGSKWNGKTFYKEDDDYREGKLIESCFRAFESGIQSYREHTEFLMDSKKTRRYGFLFEYQSDDYVAWALGLKKAGYATDPKYPDKLINIIEKYELYKYDRVVISNNSPEKEAILASGMIEKPSAVKIPRRDHANPSKRYKTNQVNGVKFVTCKGGDTPESISKMHNISIWSILEYNEEIIKKDQVLNKGLRVFLGEKKKSFKSKKFHIVRKGESMYDIAQEYGLSLKALYSRNRFSVGEEPLPGEKIQLKGMRISKTVKLDEKPYEPEFLFEEDSL